MGVLFNVNSTGVHCALGAKLVQVGRYSLGWQRRRIRSLRVLSIARYWVWQKLTLPWFYLLGLTTILLNA